MTAHSENGNPSLDITLAALLLLTFLNAAAGFRFNEGEGLGGGLFGESGLTHVPRMGKRGNPFDSRFRFRFNNW